MRLGVGYSMVLVSLPCDRLAVAQNSLHIAGLLTVWSMDPAATRTTCDAKVYCGSGVNALEALSDGRLAAGGDDGKVLVVNIEASSIVNPLEGHTLPVTSLTALPDGYLASGSADTTVRVWDLARGTCVATLEGHASCVRALAAVPGGRLASGSEDKTVRLWDVSTRTCIAVLAGHTDRVYSLAALPDGRLASGATDGTINFWDVRTAIATGSGTTALGGTLAGSTGILALLPLPGGRLASASSESVQLWELPPT